MKSMTGYAYREISKDDKTVSVEFKSYNHRFLELSIHLPSWLSSLEFELRNYLTGRFFRGKIEVGIRIKEENPNITVRLNDNAALSYYKAIKELSEKLTITVEPELGMILGREGVLETEIARDLEEYRGIIMPLLTDAADQLEEERIREGEHTRKDIISHLSLIEESVKMVSIYAPGLEISLKETLRQRFEELLGDHIDENRILAETAVLLVKHSISEELSRLSSHLSAFRHEAEHNPSPGKKLDFLSQEINREINTIGSKTPVLEVSRAVVEMKNALENIREQLRNIE